MGPGLITGASDDDPSGIAAYSQMGAQFSYGLGWTLLFSYPLVCAIRQIAAGPDRRHCGRNVGAHCQQSAHADEQAGQAAWVDTDDRLHDDAGACRAHHRRYLAGPVIYVVEDFAASEAFLQRVQPGREACRLVASRLPGMSGPELLHHLRSAGNPMPAIMITGNGDVPTAVRAMAAGASDFIEKPVGGQDLLASIDRASDRSRDASLQPVARTPPATSRGSRRDPEQILDMVLAGRPSKNIAADLGMSRRTVEDHRASIMRKTGSKSLPALARLALAAA